MTVPVEWELLPTLGVLPDAEIARVLGCSTQCVRTHRRRLGIPACGQGPQPDRAPRPDPRGDPQPRRWHDVARPLLGTLTDAEVARIVGVSKASIVRYRQGLGVAPHGHYRGPRRGSRWEDLPLGHVPDAEIAAQLGVSRQRVHQVRQDRGLAPARLPGWQRGKTKLPSDLPYGQVPDVEIARQQGVSPATVGYQRRRLGIGPYRRPNATWRAVAVPLLGTMPDSAVARIAGVHLQTILRLRKQRGIASWTAQGGRRGTRLRSEGAGGSVAVDRP